MPAKGSGEADQSGAKAVERLVSILTVLAEEGRPLGIAEVAEAASLPQATVHRLLTAFKASGWVDKDAATARYRLGHAMLGPAAVALATAPLIERSQPIITRMAEIAGATVLIGVLVGRNVVFLTLSSPGQETATLSPGFSRPAHCSAAGKVLLAALSPDERRRLFRGRAQLRRFTDATITDIDALEEHLAVVRRQGYAYDMGEFREYQRSVAVPVTDAEGHVVAAMVCSGRTERMAPEHMTFLHEEMSILADQLSRQAGLGD
jgi:DNA-binding IclR family transcriptional regulator